MSDFKPRGHGYIPDERSDKDHSFEAHFGGVQTIPTSADLGRFVVDIFDQGGAGACTGFGNGGAVLASRIRHGVAALVATGVEEAEAIRQVAATLGIPSFMAGYYWGRSYDGTTGEDAGAQPRNVMRGMHAMGVLPAEAWPYTDDTRPGSRLYQRPPVETDRLAIDVKPNYKRINSVAARCDAIAVSLGAGRLVSFGGPVSDAFCRNKFDPKKPLSAPKDIRGYHCQFFDAFETSGGIWRARAVNSWSRDFGDDGKSWMDASYVAVLSDLSSIDCPPPPPAPSP